MADNCLWQDVNGGKRVPKRRDLAFVKEQELARCNRIASIAVAGEDLLAACEKLMRYAREVCKPQAERLPEETLDEILADAIIAAGLAVDKAQKPIGSKP